MTPLDLISQVFDLDPNFVKPLKNPDYFIDIGFNGYRSMWENDKRFNELIELLISEWGEPGKCSDDS